MTGVVKDRTELPGRAGSRAGMLIPGSCYGRDAVAGVILTDRRRLDWTPDMKTRLTFILTVFVLMADFHCRADVSRFSNVVCEGGYKHHLQGVCTNENDAVYWSFTTELVKTDRQGRVQRKVPVVSHHGDLCFHDGKLFVAVNLGSFNDPKGNADSWVYIYDAESLNFLSKHETQEVFHGAGGIGVRDDRFYVVGGLPDGVEENYVYEYDKTFQFVKRHVVSSGWTRLGIQAVTFHDDAWWFGCYGSPAILLKMDANFRMLGRFELDCSLGIVGVAKDRLLMAKGPRTNAGRWQGALHLARPDPKRGLVPLLEPVSALDKQRVKQTGNWGESRFRFAAAAAASTTEDRAALEYDFHGIGVAVRLGGHNVPAYGSPHLGSLLVTIDGGSPQKLTPRSLPREVVLAEGLAAGGHRVRVEHRLDGDDSGCRIESFFAWNEPRGELRFRVNGDANTHLVDCRAIVRRGDVVVRNSLVRNWLTGQCSLAGLEPGDNYSLEVRAVGWLPARSRRFVIRHGTVTEVPAIYLRRDPSTVTSRFRFPRLNQQAIRKAGETFPARFLGYSSTIDEVTISRRVGPAVISRVCAFKENETAAYYYDREVDVTLPSDTPSGVYDLAVQTTGGRRTGYCESPRSVHVVREYPTDPVFVTFGHLDTSGQNQAEYLERLAAIANLLAPNAVLCSTACNPAYISGALAKLDMPYVINFGNHQFPGHEAWYGDPVGAIDFGSQLSILNFGHPWHVDKSRAEVLLASRSGTAVRVINAFESNAPLDFLDRHQIRMIHDGHGTGSKVADLGSTPTRRIGKSNSESFRVVRFRDGRVESCTYNGHETAPIPFAREAFPPLSVSFNSPNDGTQTSISATVTNRLADAYPNGRVTFVVPAGAYGVTGGRLESQILSDNRRLRILNVRLDIPASGSVDVSVVEIP